MVSVLAAMTLSGCDLLTFINEPSKKPPAPKPRTRHWVCEAVLAPNCLVCSADGRVVTVTLAHVVVPGGVPRKETAEALSAYGVTNAIAERLAVAAFREVTNRLACGVVSLSPSPEPGQRTLRARMATGAGDELAAVLLERGLAVIDHSGSEAVPPVYTDLQQHAADTEQGIWTIGVSAGRRFAVRGSVRVEREASRAKANDIERTTSVRARCVASVTVTAAGPPKPHTLVVSLTPKTKANDNSGPLDTFAARQAPAVTRTVTVEGGSNATVSFDTEACELTRVTRAGRDVFTGSFIVGYDLAVTCEGATVFRHSGTFDDARTINELQ